MAWPSLTLQWASPVPRPSALVKGGFRLNFASSGDPRNSARNQDNTGKALEVWAQPAQSVKLHFIRPGKSAETS
jgi:hypothetical protein